MVAHIVKQEDQADDTYDQLKAALVSSHTMSDYQRIELLSKVELLGGRKPSVRSTGHHAGALPTRPQDLSFLLLPVSSESS
jgi:hypothetical protein